MGAFAEGFAAYTQPLLDQTDGSLEQMNKAFTISQLCYNLALLGRNRRPGNLGGKMGTLDMGMTASFTAELRRLAFPRA